MKKSELRKLIKEIIKEQLAPMKGDKPIPTGMTLYTIPCVNGLYKLPSGPISNMNTSIYPSALIDDKTPSQSDVGKTVGGQKGQQTAGLLPWAPSQIMGHHGDNLRHQKDW